MSGSQENIPLEPATNDDEVQVAFAPEPANGDIPSGQDEEPQGLANGSMEKDPEDFKRDHETGEDAINGDFSDHMATVDIDHDELDAEARARERQCVYFDHDDERLRIDYVLVYKDDPKKPQRAETRRIFQKNLEEYDLVVYESPDPDITDPSLRYILLHAPWDVLVTGAELIGLKKRLKMSKTLEKKLERMHEKGCCADGCRTSQQYIEDEGDFFTAVFHANRLDLFDVGDPKMFFNNSERGLIVQEILARTSFTPEDSNETRFGVTRLVQEGIYHAAYPIHDGPYNPVGGVVCEEAFAGEDKERALLYETWARPARCFSYQPLDLIRRYFGEKLGLYFAWLGYYTQMLIPATVMGLAAFIYGLVTLFQDPIGNDICQDEDVQDFTMCPQCNERCDYWKLKESCIYSRITYVFDNYATIVFTFLMTVWATIFLEFWKRKQAELQYEWDVQDFEAQERMRPEFEFKVRKRKENPVTGDQEPYLTKLSWCCRAFTSMTIALFFVLLVVGTILGVIIYRFVIVAILYSAPIAFVSTWAKIITSLTASVINLIVILILGQIYRRVAYMLTEMELHRTETDFEDAYIFKMFIFQFANFYGTTFYIAFFKGKFQAEPGSKRFYLFGKFEPDPCDPSGCMIDLLIQLFIVMVGKQALNQIKEFIIPKLCVCLRQKRAKRDEKAGGVYTRWMQDQDMQNVDRLMLFEEYLEMVIQYGFVTIFVAAFPLAPLFALINNIIEIRLDAYKLVTQYKRPNANRAQDIGVWYNILETITYIAVLTNAVIISWTSDFIPRMVYLVVYSENQTLHGYVNDSLSYFNTNDYPNGTEPDNPGDEFQGLQMCRYKGYQRPPDDPVKPYGYTLEYWHVIVARLAFILIFEHCCLVIKYLISYLIPDVSADVKRLIAYEKSLNRHLMFKSTMEEKKEIKKQQNTAMSF